MTDTATVSSALRDLEDRFNSLLELIRPDDAVVQGVAFDVGRAAGASMSRVVLPDGVAFEQVVRREMARSVCELRIALPGAACCAASLEDLARGSIDAIGRKVEVRTIYQHTARFSENSKSYVRQVVAAGGQVRTLDEFFERLVVVDEAAALLAVPEEPSAVAVIREPLVVAFLSDLYDRSWTRAAEYPFEPTHAARAVNEVGPAVRSAIISMLIEGHPDKRIARRLGLSVRTTAEHVARLRSELGAKNRTQMGYLLAKLELERG